MDKLELAAYVVQYLDIPLVVKKAHKLRQDHRAQELQIRWENLVERLEQVEVQQTQASPVLWPELERTRWGLIHQLNQLSDQIRLLELNYPLPVRTVLDGRDEDVQLQRPSSIFWEHHDDLSGLKAISFARGTTLREAHDSPSSTAMGYPCICGQCYTGICEARLNLLRWADSRNVSRSWQLSSILGIHDLSALPIVGNDEDRGLAYLELVLPVYDSGSQTQSVCLNCKWFGTSFFRRATSFEISAMHMPVYRIKAAARLCAFCKLLCRAMEELVRPSRLYSFRSSIYTIRLQAVNCILRTTHISKMKLFKKRKSGEKFITAEFDPPPFPLQKGESSLVLHSIALSSSAESFTSSQIVPKTQIHLPLLKSWLSECVTTHGDACNGRHLPNADGKLHSLRVVDVLEYHIVRHASALPYIALSYVWGQIETLQLTRANEAEYCRPGALLNYASRIPKTILDAFEAVKAMGERYLWVDALCIIQDAGDKEIHLQDMHLVYGAALLTIVAGHGNDASAGLPGIRPSSRLQSQQFEEIYPDVGLAVSLPLPDAINSSRWFSRAWTYQEQLLSRRFLIFIGEQVIWQCPSEVSCEDTLADNKTKVYERLQHMSAPVDVSTCAEGDHQLETRYGFRRPPAFQRYADVVAEYTGRQLTFSEDILRAFSGLSKIFMLDLNTELMEGLPLSYLDAALLWQPRHQLRRRKGIESFASWSWAGWEGRVAYEDTSARGNIEGIIPLVKWNLHRSELVNKSGVGTKPYLLDSGFEASRWSTPFEPPLNDTMCQGK
jgi:hypothetical protein